LADILVGDINAEITEGSKAVSVRVAWVHKVGDCLSCYVAAALLNWKTRQAPREGNMIETISKKLNVFTKEVPVCNLVLINLMLDWLSVSSLRD
jgi:hypothetical protein